MRGSGAVLLLWPIFRAMGVRIASAERGDLRESERADKVRGTDATATGGGSNDYEE